MTDTVGNGARRGARPEEHLVIERLEEILKRPTVLKAHISSMKGALISNPDFLAIDGDRHAFRSLCGNDRVSFRCPKQPSRAHELSGPTDSLNVSLIRQVEEVGTQRLELLQGEWQGMNSISGTATMSVGQ